VTGRGPWGHLRVRSVQAEVRAKELSERTLAAVHRRVRCIFARQRTQATGRSASASGANDVSVWRGQVITGRWAASDCPPTDASDARFPSLKPYWSQPDAGSVASGANERRVRCGMYASAISFRPLAIQRSSFECDTWQTSSGRALKPPDAEERQVQQHLRVRCYRGRQS
jgi:hypothetical protein